MVLGRWLNNVNKVLTVQAWKPEFRVHIYPLPHIYTHTNTQAHFSVQNAFACNSKTGRVDTGESPRLINSLIESVAPRFSKRLCLKRKVQSN